MEISIETPIQCMEKIKLLKLSTLEELMDSLDTIAVQNKFQIIKKNGDKEYVYLFCHKSGKGKGIPGEQKKRQNNSQKTSNNSL